MEDLEPVRKLSCVACGSSACEYSSCDADVVVLAAVRDEFMGPRAILTARLEFEGGMVDSVVRLLLVHSQSGQGLKGPGRRVVLRIGTVTACDGEGARNV
jgi:hypothetical protein